jgi:hypothetical protein
MILTFIIAIVLGGLLANCVYKMIKVACSNDSQMPAWCFIIVLCLGTLVVDGFAHFSVIKEKIEAPISTSIPAQIDTVITIKHINSTSVSDTVYIYTFNYDKGRV